MSGKFYTIREDIIYFLINNIDKQFSEKEFILTYLHKNLYFEKGINQYERFTEIHEINKILQRMVKKGYINIKQKKITLNFNNDYVKKISERIEKLSYNMIQSYNAFKINKNFMDNININYKNKNKKEDDINDMDFEEYEKEFSDDDRDLESEYDENNDSDEEDEMLDNNINNFNKDIKDMIGVNGIYKIKSDNSKDIYIVDAQNKTCTCKGFLYSVYSPPICKHIIKFNPIQKSYRIENNGKRRKKDTVKYEFIYEFTNEVNKEIKNKSLNEINNNEILAKPEYDEYFFP